MPIATIEQTSKKWKGLQLTGGLLSVLGVPVVMLGGEQTPVTYMGLAIMIGGLVLFIYARGMAWWHHG